MIKKSAGQQSIVSNRHVPPLDMLKKEGTREKTRSARSPDAEKSVRTQRDKAAKAVGFATEEKTAGTERRTKRASEKPEKPTRLLRQQSEKSIREIEPEKKNNKKENPSGPVTPKSEKPPTSIFSRKKKPAPVIPSAAKAAQAQATPAKLPTPPSNSANCCRDMLRIFKEDQFASLREPLRVHCDKRGVDEQHDFLKAIAGYSSDQLPTRKQAQNLIDTYGPKGTKPLNIETDNTWTTNPWDTAQAAVEGNDMAAFFATVMGPDHASNSDFASAILPQLALGLAQKYAPFVQAHTPEADA